MKRTLTMGIIFLLLSGLLSITALAHSCVDKDRDYWCDECGMLIYHTCVDTNKDTWCDKCSCWIPHDCYDRNNDHECDQCGTVMNISVHITVNSYLSPEQNMLLSFSEGHYPSINKSLYGLVSEHTFSCAANSSFRLMITKYGHPARSFSYSTYLSDICINTTLYPYGDVSQDGKVNVGDTARTYSHVRSTSLLTDDYALECADVSGDGKVNVGDVAKIYSHIRGTASLW